MGCFSGFLMSSASIQKLFCGIYSAFKCSSDEFVGEKVVSQSYSSTIFQTASREVALEPLSSLPLISHVWLCYPMDCRTSGLPVHHQLLELAQTHVHRVGDAIQPSSPPAFNLSEHQSLFQLVSSSHQVAKVLELQLQHQTFQQIFRTNFLYN